jgi:hypothetical protein
MWQIPISWGAKGVSQIVELLWRTTMAKGYTDINDDYPQHLKVIQWRYGFWMVQFVQDDEVEDGHQHEAPQYPSLFRSPAVRASCCVVELGIPWEGHGGGAFCEG